MKSIQLICLVLICFSSLAWSQVSNYPAPDNQSTILLKGATIHIGKDKQVIINGEIVIGGDKILYVGETGKNNITTTQTKVVDMQGKHIYPSLILSNSQLGLNEVAAVRSSLDAKEIGMFNTNIDASISYNTDSRIINNVRDNGILLANIAPTGDGFTGRSSVMQFDAWNWEDAIYKSNVATHLYLPVLLNIPNPDNPKATQKSSKQYQEKLDKIEEIKNFLKEAKSYCNSEATPATKNLRFDVLRPLFNKAQKLFVHCNFIKEMLVAVDLQNEFDIDVVIVGGYDAWRIADILKKYDIPVILESIHSLPAMEDDDIKQPFLNPAILHQKGILVGINQENTHNRGKNLAYLAGTSAAYGLDKEEALQTVTYNVAKILGIERYTGSIERGKDANIVITEGDLLDMRTSKLVDAYLQGRKIKLDNVHKELKRRYEYKYDVSLD